MKYNFIKTIAIAAALTCTAPVMAAEIPNNGNKEEMTETTIQANTKVTSSNGVVSITLPDASWKEVNNDHGCITFSNGSSTIVFNHFLAEDGLPDLMFSDKEDEYYCQSIESHNGLILYFVGYAESKEEIHAVEEAIASAEVDVEKIEEEIHEKEEEENKVVPADYTAYVNATSLFIRPVSDTSQEPIGTLKYGDQVQVTGTVMKKGLANGWVQISLNNGQTGYVNGDFLTTQKPQPVIQQTYTVFRTSDNYSINISLYSDGSYQDSNGNRYYLIGNETWKDGNGNTYSTTPVAPSVIKEITVYGSNGSSRELFFYTDNTIRDGYGDYYRQQDSEVYVNNRTGEAFKTYPEDRPTIVDTINITDEIAGEGTIHTELYLYSDGTYRDNNGDYYTEFENSYTNQRTGQVFYTDSER